MKIRTEAPTDWRPAVPPAAREAILRAVQEIAGCLRTYHPPAAVNPSLASGAGGLAVLFAELATALKVERYEDDARAYWQAAVEGLERRALPHGLLSGVAGVGWTTAYLESLALVEGAHVHAAAEDLFLTTMGDDVVDRYGLDLAHGLVGMGVYALERLPRPSARRLVSRVVDALVERADRSDGACVWPSRPPADANDWRAQYPDGYVDLGLAHGAAGIVSFLSRVVLECRDHGREEHLLRDALAGLGSMRQKGLSFGYPSLAPAAGPPLGGRLAWCYGDLAVASSLVLAARATKEARWRDEAVQLAVDAPHDRPGTAGVRDVGFCHGSAGIFHILQRLHGASDDARLAGAARVWLDRTFSMRRAGHGVAGFMPSGVSVSDPAEEDPGLLVGATGTALALLSAVTDHPPAWDRALLLSSRVW